MFKYIKVAVAGLFFLTFSTLVHAEAPGISEAIVVDFQSEIMAEKRPIHISLPDNYQQNKTKRYPVLYVLNDEDNFGWAVYIEDLLASRRGLDKMIVVGLPHTGNYGNDNRPFGSRENNDIAEGAKKFEHFIRQEVLPYIDKNYRTERSKFIVGHSLAGLFVTHLFSQDPTGFNAHIALSPSYHHGPNMIEVMEEKFDSGAIKEGIIYLTVGGLEHRQIQGQYDRMRKLFNEKAPDGLTWEVDVSEHNDHNIVAFAGMMKELAWLYHDYSLTGETLERLSPEEIVAYYDALSARLGYVIVPFESRMTSMGNFLASRFNKIDMAVKSYTVAQHYYPDSIVVKQGLFFYRTVLEHGIMGLRMAVTRKEDLNQRLINSVGYALLGGARFAESIEIFSLGAEYFPTPNAFDSLGEAYEAAGQYEDALKAFKQALKLATEQNNARFMKREKKNIARMNKIITHKRQIP